jgi:hypothetical protein
VSLPLVAQAFDVLRQAQSDMALKTVSDVIQRFRKVEEATSTRDEPAPVYLLDEIAELSRQSPDAAQGIADHVAKRLGVKSPTVKFKVCSESRFNTTHRAWQLT